MNNMELALVIVNPRRTCTVPWLIGQTRRGVDEKTALIGDERLLQTTTNPIHQTQTAFSSSSTPASIISKPIFFTKPLFFIGRIFV